VHGVATTEEVFAGIRELVVARRPRFQTETTQALHKSSTTRLAHHRRDKPVAVETSRTRWKVRHIPLEPACFLCARFLRDHPSHVPQLAHCDTMTSMAQETPSVLIRRALTQKCPVCGRGAVFASHFRMNRTCPKCNVVFWADPGESLGAMYLDYAVATAVFIVLWVGLSWTTSLSDVAQWIIISVVTVASVLACYPITRSAWTVLVYISGGIERPRLKIVRGGRT